MTKKDLRLILLGGGIGWIFSSTFMNPPFEPVEAIVAIALILIVVILEIIDYQRIS